MDDDNDGTTTQNPSAIVPDPEAGSDTDRLLKGINRQVSITLLELNALLGSGSNLTQKQTACLGSFDPALGEPLLKINCAEPLNTGDVQIFLQQATYYDTPECRNAIFNARTGDCLLENARLSIPAQFAPQESGNDGPIGARLIAAGLEISYAVDGSTAVRIENAEPPLTGLFQCDINLLNNNTTAPANSQPCTTTINMAANRFDTLLPETP